MRYPQFSLENKIYRDQIVPVVTRTSTCSSLRSSYRTWKILVNWMRILVFSASYVDLRVNHTYLLSNIKHSYLTFVCVSIKQFLWKLYFTLSLCDIIWPYDPILYSLLLGSKSQVQFIPPCPSVSNPASQQRNIHFSRLGSLPVPINLNWTADITDYTSKAQYKQASPVSRQPINTWR